MQLPLVTCNYDGFAWHWNWELRKWMLDIVQSGGSPSPHERSPEEPPCVVELDN